MIAVKMECELTMQKSNSILVFAYSLLAMVSLLLLGPCLIGQDRLAFRDASHFYTPLYSYVAERQQQDWFPLWNPLDLTGVPLAGETTTAVLYPVRMLVYAAALNSETALAWYVVVHLGIAAVSIHIAARLAGAGPLGCAVSVIAYPLSGPIFFLIYNPPFLVGAAWTPLMIVGVLRVIGKPDRFWMIVTSLAMAMTILGGDPQAVVHVMLLGVVYLFVCLGRHWSGVQELRSGAILSLLGSAVLGAAVAAPQLAASIDWSMQSSRLITDTNATRLDFSIPPWHWLELVVPEASGRLFPVNTRLSHLIPGDGRTWIVTLSAGMLLLICSLHRYTTQSWRTFDLWDCLVFIALLFSLATPFAFLGQVIPGYHAFRFPGKWTVFLPLGMAIVTARQVDRLVRFPPKSIEHICLVVTAGCLIIAGVFANLTQLPWFAWLSDSVPSDRFWGEFQPEVACELACWSALKSAAVASVIWGSSRLIRLLESNRPVVYREMVKWMPSALLCLVAAEMTWIGFPQMATVNRSEEQRLLASFAGPNSDGALQHRSIRKSTAPAWPQQWRVPSQENQRVLEVEVSQRGTRFGRWHLANGESLFNSVTSITPMRTDLLWRAIKGDQSNQALKLKSGDWSRIQAWLGIDREWIANALPNVSDKALRDSNMLAASDLRLLRMATSQTENVSCFTWEARYRSIPVVKNPTVTDMRERLSEIINGTDLAPLVENYAPDQLEAGDSSQSLPTLELSLNTPERLRFNVATEQAGILNVKMLQDGNWRATLTSKVPRPADGLVVSRVVDIHRVDYLFMGVKIPAGRWEVELVYRPWWLKVSFLISGSGLLAIAWMLRKLVKRDPA
jgi:hypothetical protein